MSAERAERGERTFDGYRRPDGRLGVRNRVLVLPSVICSHTVAEGIADRSPDAVAAPHDHGCGQLGADSDQTKRALVGVASNPNVAGTLVVGLGCEKVRSRDVAAAVDDRGLPVRELTIQDAGGTEACTDRGAAAVEALSERAAAATADPAGLGDLTVGVVVSDLDDSTVERTHPLLAGVIERVTRAGGRVAVAGAERFAAHPEAARARVDGHPDALDRVLDAD
ncbi:UxaA family hydrolase, partial [Candidatus Halobonum tyrrellensis]